MAKLSNIIIGVIFLGLIVSGLGIFISDVTIRYGKSDLDSNFTSVFISESKTTVDLMESAKDQMLTVEDDQNSVFDRLGAFFRGGYDAAKSLFSSFTSVGRLITTSVSSIPGIGSFGSILSTYLIAIVLVILIVSILLNFLIKSDRT